MATMTIFPNSKRLLNYKFDFYCHLEEARPILSRPASINSCLHSRACLVDAMWTVSDELVEFQRLSEFVEDDVVVVVTRQNI